MTDVLPQHLTPAEQRLLVFLQQPMSNQEIMAETGWTHGSVKVYLSSVYKKTGKRRHELEMPQVTEAMVLQAMNVRPEETDLIELVKARFAMARGLVRKGSMFDSPEIEQYYRVKTVAARLGLSRQTVERRFADIDGGKRDGTSRSTRSKRKYAIMLIPESAIRAYLDSLRE